MIRVIIGATTPQMPVNRGLWGFLCGCGFCDFKGGGAVRKGYTFIELNGMAIKQRENKKNNLQTTFSRLQLTD